jgi:hypothetical protein
MRRQGLPDFLIGIKNTHVFVAHIRRSIQNPPTTEIRDFIVGFLFDQLEKTRKILPAGPRFVPAYLLLCGHFGRKGSVKKLPVCRIVRASEPIELRFSLVG